MWTSVAASGFGDRMMMLAALALLGGLAKGADSTSIQAATQFWFFLPYIFFSVPGGWLADHLPRKWLLLVCDQSRSLLLFSGFLMILGATGPAAIASEYHWRIAAILFAVGTFAAVFNPTRNAIIPQIIPRPQLTAANAVILGLSVIASMIGIIVGDRIITPEAASSVRHGLLLAASFYFVSGWFFAFLRPTQPRQLNSPVQRRSFRQATRYIASHRRVMVLIGLNVLIWASAATVSSAIMGLGKTHFGLSGNELLRYFAQASAAIGLGMLVGAGLVASIQTRRESTIALAVGMILAGTCVLMLAAVPHTGVTYFAAFGVGAFGNVVIISVISLLQEITPNYVRGRVMGVNSMINTACSVATYLAIWRLPAADRNIITVLFLLGPALTIIGAIGLFGHLRRGPQPDPHANLFWRLDRWFVLMWHNLRWSGRHHIPADGPVVLASNHTAGLDPLLIQAACGRVVRWVMLSSYQFRLLTPVWRVIQPIALDRDAGDMAKVRQMMQVLREGEVIGIFPEGGLQESHRELKPFEPGIARIAQRTGAAIVPVWIADTPKSASMLLQFLKPSRSTVAFGEPFTPSPDAPPEQVLEELRQRMQALANKF